MTFLFFLSDPPIDASIIGVKDYYFTNQTVDLKCSATPGNPTNMSFSWFDNGTEIQRATQSRYSFRGDLSNRTLECRASNGEGSVKSTSVKISIQGLLFSIMPFIIHMMEVATVSLNDFS